MTEEEIREGDIAEIDYIAEFTKEHINEGKALVIWKGNNHQPLVRKLGTKTTTWICYEHIAKVVSHIDIEGYMDKALKQEPCEDAISRDELLKAIDTWDKFGCDADTKLVPYQDHYIPYIHYDDVVKCIKGMPSVTPKPKMGHWIENYAEDGCDELYSHWICSECGRSVGFNYADIEDVLSEYPYCHCGAKMTESEDDEE